MTSRGNIVAVALAMLACAPAHAADNAARGETIATEACSACHQVTTRQALPPPVPNPEEGTNVPAPGFLDIANAHGGDQDYLRRMILNPPHPMREQNWDEADLKSVVDYITSLRRQPAR